jgi:hypothetical protein
MRGVREMAASEDAVMRKVQQAVDQRLRSASEALAPKAPPN